MSRSSAAVPADAVAAERIPARLRLAVAGDYLLSHLGFFTVAPVLAAVLARDGGGTVAGLALFGFNFAMRGASLFLSALISRLAFRTAAMGGLATSAACFGLLALPSPVALQVALLIGAGCGISVNGATVRLYIASSVRRSSSRQRVFTLVQVTVNVSAAVGPLLGSLLFDGPRWILFGAVAALYGVAAITVAVLVPPSARIDEPAARSPLRWSVLRGAWMHGQLRSAVGLTILGGFLYAQFFSGIALEIMGAIESPGARAMVFVLNAVLVVALQLPVTAVIARSLDRGRRPSSVAAVGLGLFCAALVALGVSGATVAGLVVVVVVFSLGETVYTPTVDTLFIGIQGAGGLLELINLRLASAAVGESIGAFAGTSLVLALGDAHRGAAWSVLAAVAAALALGLVRWTARPTAER